MSCSKYTITNNSGKKIYFNYRNCENGVWENQVQISNGEFKNIWLVDNTYATAFNNENLVVSDEGVWPPTPTPTPVSLNSFTITSSRVADEGSFGATFTGVTNSGYTLTDNLGYNQLYPAYYFYITDDDSDITSVFIDSGMTLNNQGYMFTVTWGPGSTSSTLAKVSYNSGSTQMFMIAVDPSNANWEIDNSIQGTALEGTFNFPATFTPYLPITDKNDWC